MRLLLEEHKTTVSPEDQVVSKATEEFEEKVREYVVLKERYDEKKLKLNRELKPLEKKLKVLEKELKDWAKERSIHEYKTASGRGVEFNPTVRRVINAREFFKFAQKAKAEDLFWELVSVSVTKAIAAFGEMVLEEKGVLRKEIDDFSRITVI